ncbi:hypothetical protein BCR34DRAFT_583746 [Clohesyomyces aquaticus]|uniref:Uncharacterized protein n=1 Tax=Clohesyomyces aquaticus TaxID=1231657 RepID=A0A1Y2A441_9PLEO|nr:hypothetical protein BCR34DRAFT_583746 [Clohesyomyces aquaticus]
MKPPSGLAVAGCTTGLLVVINDIVLHWPNGTDTSLFQESKLGEIEACIVPGFSGVMSLPRAYADSFKARAGGLERNGREARSVGLNYDSLMYEANNTAYLTVNYESGQFSLGPLAPDADGDSPSNDVGTMRVIGEDGVELNSTCTRQTGGRSSATPSAKTDSTGELITKASIAGIAIGGIFGSAFIAGMAWLFWRRYHRAKKGGNAVYEWDEGPKPPTYVDEPPGDITPVEMGN